MIKKSFAAVLASLFLICGAASLKADSATVFPPAGCSKNFERVITWKNGATSTACMTLDALLKKSFPHCKDGQVLAKEDGKFVCRSIGAADLGRQYYGNFCPNSNHCYAFCPKGKVVMTGGCFSNRAYGLQGSKPVVYDRPVAGNGDHNPSNPDGANSVEPGPDAYEGWQCIYPTASSPPTDIEAHVVCINSGLEGGNGSDDDGRSDDTDRDPI